MKTVVFGYSGSGKSTLAAAIAEKEGVPLLHLDRVHWLPGWVENDPAEEKRIVEAFLRQNKSWVIDGNYGKLFFDLRMAQADRIIFLGFGRFACLKRVLTRYLRFRGKARSSMTEGCEEKIDWAFVRWVLWGGRSPAHRRRYGEVLERYPQKAIAVGDQRSLTELYRENGWEEPR